MADVIRSHIRQEYPGLRQRLQRIAAGEMPKYDVMMSKGFRMAIEKMIQRMDEVRRNLPIFRSILFFEHRFCLCFVYRIFSIRLGCNFKCISYSLSSQSEIFCISFVYAIAKMAELRMQNITSVSYCYLSVIYRKY